MLTSVSLKRILSLLMCLVLLAAVGLSARAETRTNPDGMRIARTLTIVGLRNRKIREPAEPNVTR